MPGQKTSIKQRQRGQGKQGQQAAANVQKSNYQADGQGVKASHS